MAVKLNLEAKVRAGAPKAFSTKSKKRQFHTPLRGEGGKAEAKGRESQAADVSAFCLNSGKSQSGLTSAATLDGTDKTGRIMKAQMERGLLIRQEFPFHFLQLKSHGKRLQKIRRLRIIDAAAPTDVTTEFTQVAAVLKNG